MGGAYPFSAAGFLPSLWGKHPRRRIVTIADLPAGASTGSACRPAQGVNVTFKPAPTAKKDKASIQLSLEEAG